MADNEYAPANLRYSGTYYWRINETDEAAGETFEGDIWSFSIPQFQSIDDFEIYHDEEFFEIWSVWIDGFEDDNNGAIVGNGNEAERMVVAPGSRQSMPIHYDNSSAGSSSVRVVACVDSVTCPDDQAASWTLLVTCLGCGVNNRLR